MTDSVFADRKVAWCVTISGLTDRYYSGCLVGELPSTTITGGLPATYRDVRAVHEIGPRRSSIDEVGGVATQAPVEVTLLAREADAAGETLPINTRQTLRKISWRDSTKYTRLRTSLPHSFAVVDIETDDDVSGWDVPGFIHSGQETFWADSTAGDGSDGDPWRFTDCARAVAHSQAQDHRRNAARGDHPYITSDVVNWQGRRAFIQMGAVAPDGSVIEWREYWRGFIDAEAKVDAAGYSLKFSIAPLTAVLGWQMSIGIGSTRYVRGWHAFGKGCYSSVLYLMWRAGGAALIGATAPGGTTGIVTADGIKIGQGAADAFFALFDPSLPEGHPRRAMLEGEGDDGVLYASLLSENNPAGFDTIDIDAGVLGQRFTNQTVTEESRVPIIDVVTGADLQLVHWASRWPVLLGAGEAWQAAIGGCRGLDQGTAQGEGGRWAHFSIDQGPNGWRLRGRLNSVSTPGPLYVQAYFEDNVTIGMSFLSPEEGRLLRHPPDGLRRPLMQVTESRNSDGWDEVDILGPMEAWYQQNEGYLGPFVDDPYTGGGEIQYLRISGRQFGEDWRAEFQMTGSQLMTDPDTGDDVGYVVSVRGRNIGKTHVEREVDEPLTVTPLAKGVGVSFAEFLLRLMLSGRGEGTNGVYDVLPYGANFKSSEVSSASFLSFPVPPELQDQTFECSPDKTIGEQYKGVLMVGGCQLVQRLSASTHTWAVALVPLGWANAADSVATILDGDIIADARPSTDTDGRVIRSYVLKLNHGIDGKDPLTIPVVDGDAVSAGNGNMGERLELDLPGVRIDATVGDLTAAATTFTTGIRARLGIPRKRYDMTVDADGEGLADLAIADTVTLTCPDVEDIGATMGVTDRPCRVMAVEDHPSKRTLRIGLVARPGNVAGIVPAMYVESVGDATHVTVKANRYTLAEHPVTGAAQRDDDYFIADDVVWCIPAGDFAGKAQLTIVGIAAGVVEFSGAHGLAIGDTIRHAAYDDVAERVQGYAYLGDDADHLGAANDEASIIG